MPREERARLRSLFPISKKVRASIQVCLVDGGTIPLVYSMVPFHFIPASMLCLLLYVSTMIVSKTGAHPHKVGFGLPTREFCHIAISEICPSGFTFWSLTCLFGVGGDGKFAHKKKTQQQEREQGRFVLRYDIVLIQSNPIQSHYLRKNKQYDYLLTWRRPLALFF